MNRNFKKILSFILAVVMVFGVVPAPAFAAETKPTVKIVSFMRGEQSDLRSSELLEARVEGYDGNVRDLTYKWYNELGTYLYVYNSHNMYNINNTDGEQEIYNKNVSSSSNMSGRSHKDSFSGKGYAWAAIYGASLSGSKLAGKITVEVYENGKLLCSDSHEGKYSNRKNTGIVTHNLDADMDNVVIGMFEGEEKNVLDLLGESSIVHITCVESSVSDGFVVDKATGKDKGKEDNYVKLYKKDGDYYIYGKAPGFSKEADGDSKVRLIIEKGNCKFHNDSEGDAITTVFVFKKPNTSTTTTTLTLSADSLDDRCRYFIGGVEGTEQNGSIIFTGLTPNTAYTVEVRGEYIDENKQLTKYAYAYVYDVTKPVYQATVNTFLDGNPADISEIHGHDVSLHLLEQTTEEVVDLSRVEKGKYTATVETGIYYPYHKEDGEDHIARAYKLIIENTNSELNLHHYSVTYDTNGGDFKSGEAITREVFSSDAAVKATNNVPVRDGYVFSGWKYNDNIYASGAEVVSNITAPIVLTAQWEKEVNVTINVTIDHRYEDGDNKGYDHNETKDELVIDFLEMKKDSPAFVETGDKLYFSKEGVADKNGNTKSYNYETEVSGDAVLVTKYTATAATYTGLLESSQFGVALSKSGYDVGEIKKVKDANGNWTIDVPLKYNPDDFDLEFSVKMADDVPKDLYPDAVIVKIACWETNTNQWVIISQQRTTENAVRPGVRVDIDPVTGMGSGSYPVWKHEADGTPYGYRAVVAGFIYGDSTVIVPTEKNHYKDENTVVVTYTDGNYTATMGNIADGKKYNTSLNGAYYNDKTNAQQGTLDGVITVEKYDVTFDAMGGTVNGNDADIAEGQYYVPKFDAYKPVMENHNFKGWYLDEDYSVPAVEGELLVKDITLYAKWDKILNGTVIVDGYYEDEDGSQHPVDKVDRATHALIELEEITSDGTYDIAGQTVEIKWPDVGHFSEKVAYEFKGLDPDKTYRINVYLMNYEAAYQNSTTIINGNGNIHDDYFDDHYTAVYPEGELKTFVNVFLHFEPESYIQNVEVDTSYIGEGFRPDDALVKYYSQEVGIVNDYVLIVQHKDENNGVKVGLKDDGKNDGTYGEEVWKKNFNGNLYDYQANLTKLDGKNLTEWPVIVVYGDPARWSPVNQAPTDVLKVNVMPMWYGITYDFGFNVKDENGNEVPYKEVNAYGHIWSYETVIDYEPERIGYNFLGWFDAQGNKVDKIAAEVHADTTLYAKWEKRTDCSLKIYHVVKETGYPLGNAVMTGLSNIDIISVDSIEKAEYEGYTYDSASVNEIEISENEEENEITLYYTKNAYKYAFNFINEATGEPFEDVPSIVGEALYGEYVTENAVDIDGYVVDKISDTIHISADNDKNVVNFYYSVDVIGGNGDGDKTPDKYQKKVIFKIVNGTWADGTAADIVKVLDLKTDGEYDVNGTATLTSPVDMKPYNGFTDGGWDVEPPVEVSGADEVVYTYTYSTRTTTPVEPLDEVNYIVEHYKAVSMGVYNANPDETELFKGKIGETVTAVPKTYNGYAFCENLSNAEATLKAIDSYDDIVILRLYYDIDTVGSDDGEGDGTPDRYQKKIIFKVVNGTWPDGTAADIVNYVDLMKDGKYAVDGTAVLTAPVGMKANDGYEGGAWDKVPPAVVSGTNEEVFTYSFTEIKPEEPTDPEPPVDPDKPVDPETPDTPDVPGGEGEGNGNGSLDGGAHHILFGKTDGIGWYNVSKDGGQTWNIVFGNSTYEVEHGTEIIVKVGDLVGDNFVFYINGEKHRPDENGQLVITVNGYMLIGAISVVPDIDFEVPDVEESLNWFQRLIKAIKDFFAKLFGKK